LGGDCRLSSAGLTLEQKETAPPQTARKNVIKAGNTRRRLSRFLFFCHVSLPAASPLELAQFAALMIVPKRVAAGRLQQRAESHNAKQTFRHPESCQAGTCSAEAALIVNVLAARGSNAPEPAVVVMVARNRANPFAE
jgi:hypothetical protein